MTDNTHPPRPSNMNVDYQPVKLDLDTTVEVYEVSTDDAKSVYKKIYKCMVAIKWSNVIYLATLHVLFVAGVCRMATHEIKFQTVLLTGVLAFYSGIGMSVFGHRFCAHRSFKAKLALQLLLAVLQTMSMNGSAFSYARDHRTHHKYSDTEGDPKNPSRGLFYRIISPISSHVGWWMLKKTDTVKAHGAKLDFNDLRKNWVVWYQHKLYIPLFIVLGLVVPTLVPYYLWNEDLLTAFLVCGIVRITIVLHHLFTVNSIAHFFGHRPYDFRIRPTENRVVNWASLGEGQHNFHHTFSMDYRSCDKKSFEVFNPSTLFIDFFVVFGLAYDCKQASPAVIKGTIERKGIPAYFDEPASLTFRIFWGLVDWTLGFVFTLWITYPIIIYKLVTHQNMFVF